jgi:hypothetical protein
MNGSLRELCAVHRHLVHGSTSTSGRATRGSPRSEPLTAIGCIASGCRRMTIAYEAKAWTGCPPEVAHPAKAMIRRPGRPSGP